MHLCIYSFIYLFVCLFIYLFIYILLCSFNLYSVFIDFIIDWLVDILILRLIIAKLFDPLHQPMNNITSFHLLIFFCLQVFLSYFFSYFHLTCFLISVQFLLISTPFIFLLPSHQILFSLIQTTIRELAGLLSAFDLSDDKIFLDKATQLADLLMPAFETESGIPKYVLYVLI